MKIEEQNDALKRNNRVALRRYEFAIKCLGKNKEIADIGCGMGYGSYMLRKAGNYVVGFDKSEEAIDYANENYKGVYTIMDIEETKIYGFDIGVCLECLCHLKSPQKFIDNLEVKELVISAAIDPKKNDGYIYRLWNLSEKQFKDLFKGWKIIDELRQKKYLTIYIKKL